MPTGRVTRDDRGNAIWQWSPGIDTVTRRLHGLSIEDNEPLPGGAPELKTVLATVGYNPYESGLVAGKLKPKKVNLRDLSRWIEVRRRTEDSPSE